jgi:FecR protein
MVHKSPKRPEVLARWSRFPVPTDSPAASDAMRVRVVGAVARTMLATPGRRSVRGWPVGWGLLAAAVALALVGGSVLRSRMHGDPIVGRLYAQSGASHAVVHGRELDAASPASSAVALGFDSRVATDRASTSRLQLVSGVAIVVGPETRLALPETNELTYREELVLELGLIHVQVPKLPHGHFFAVRTPNALVSVHGTAFSVEVTKTKPSDSPRTKVVVTEGVVTVLRGDREVLLDAGTEWTSSVASPPASVPTASSADLVKRPSVSANPRPVARAEPEFKPAQATADAAGGPAIAKASTTDLANQNRLFSDAMSARDQGDRMRAASLLAEFIRRYPDSPLTQDAYVNRFRVLSQAGDQAAASRAARAYLSLYADGFAVEEARAAALGPAAGAALPR